jgi:Na+-translocating ferredoxin:NAD+ oxidoreductase subunit B
MDDVYKRLATILDQMPNGFPATETGVELKILQKIFAPEEAEMALKLKPVPETAEVIAKRVGMPVTETESILDIMAKKGQIWSEKKGGQQVYELCPFAIGIWDFQVNRLDKELSDLMAQYGRMLGLSLGAFGPGLLRVIPINATIEARHQVLPHEDVRRMLENARTFQVADCMCKKNAALRGRSCKHTIQSCLTFSSDEGAFDKYPLGRMISKQEAFDLLAKAEEEGLVHQTFNTKSGNHIICNCCSCSCPMLIGTKKFSLPYLIAKSNFVALINEETCEACGTCAEERCPMEAIAKDNGGYRVKPERCIGCGVCATTCPTRSIALIRKPEFESDQTPEDLADWYSKRAASRGIEFTGK